MISYKLNTLTTFNFSFSFAPTLFPVLNYSRLLNNVSGLQLFQLLRFGSFLLTGILLAKGGIGLETIGAYESLMFISGALSFFWVNALLNSLLASYPSHTEKKKYLFNVALLVLLFSGVLFITIRLAEPVVISFFSKNAVPYFHLFSFFLLLNQTVQISNSFYCHSLFSVGNTKHSGQPN